MRKLSSVMSIILVACLLVGSASATWIYAMDALGTIDNIFASTGMGEWEFGYTVSFVNETKEFFKMTENTGTPISYDDLYAETANFTATSDMDSYAQDNAIDALKVQIAQIKAGLITDVNFAIDYSKNIQFDYWINAGSTMITEIPADTEGEVVLYPSFVGMYTAMFVDQNGHIFEIDDQGNTAWTTFTSNDVSDVMTMAATLKARIQAGETADSDLTFSSWAIIEYDNNDTPDNTDDDTVTRTELTEANLKKFTKDVTISPIYDYNGDAALIPVDENSDGVTDYYQVGGYNNGTGTELVEIPDYVNGIPVTDINNDAFNIYDDLTAVRIPDTITSIGSDSFAETDWLGRRDTVTLYYDGDPNMWKQYMDIFYKNSTTTKYTSYNTLGNYASDATTILKSNWDNAMGDGSRIFFLDENGNVDLEAGYWELYHEQTGSIFNRTHYYTWIFHDHEYLETPPNNCGKNHFSGNYTDYDADGRVDKNYWITTDAAVASEETTE